MINTMINWGYDLHTTGQEETWVSSCPESVAAIVVEIQTLRLSRAMLLRLFLHVQYNWNSFPCVCVCVCAWRVVHERGGGDCKLNRIQTIIQPPYRRFGVHNSHTVVPAPRCAKHKPVACLIFSSSGHLYYLGEYATCKETAIWTDPLKCGTYTWAFTREYMGI